MPDILKKTTREAPRPEGPRPVEVLPAPEALAEAAPLPRLDLEVRPPKGGLTSVPMPASPAPGAPMKDPDIVAIENILSEGLADLYRTMSPDLQQKFKIQGEATATKIKQMIASAKVKAKNILAWIREWLRIIPGVNRFFLEQESKIKTDKILALVEKKKKND